MPSHAISKKFLLPFACTLLLACPSLSHADLINRVVAVVNDEIITLRDLQQEGAPLFEQIRREAPPMQSDEALRSARRDLLSSLIDKKIIEQRAKNLAITVSDEEVEAALQQMLANKKITREALQLELTRSGLTEDRYRALLRAQILQSKLVNYEVRSKVVITDDKIRRYYDTNYTATTTVDGNHLLQIGVTWGTQPNDRSKEEAKKIIDTIRAKAAAGENFQDLARSHSTLPSATDGGDIGVFMKEEMSSFMRQAIAAIRPGEISPVVETANAFQFFKLLASKEGGVVSQAPYETVKDEIQQKLYEEELQQNFKRWVKQLREQAEIKELL
ncbi:MAG: SurA N-terminal domain-containing protein [Desulfobulbaceae bacterium]|nr:SurA N-terminal domain-containing protein [Desulfobulbaceae bacterium]